MVIQSYVLLTQTFALVDCNSDASALDHEEEITSCALSNDTASIFVGFFVEAIANSSKFCFGELEKSLMSKRQRRVPTSERSLTEEMKRNRSSSSSRPACLTTAWKIARSMTQTVTLVLLIIVAVRLQL